MRAFVNHGILSEKPMEYSKEDQAAQNPYPFTRYKSVCQPRDTPSLHNAPQGTLVLEHYFTSTAPEITG
jgi:hypothetical protein